MAIIQKINHLFKKKFNFLFLIDAKAFRIQRFNPFFFISFIIIFSVLFFILSNLINKKNQRDESNFKEITNNNEFLNVKNFLISKINSPYEEINYIIKTNDTVEKILRKFKVKNEDIKGISVQLEQKKLINIYSGRKLNLIIKKLEDGSNSLVNFVY